MYVMNEGFRRAAMGYGERNHFVEETSGMQYELEMLNHVLIANGVDDYLYGTAVIALDNGTSIRGNVRTRGVDGYRGASSVIIECRIDGENIRMDMDNFPNVQVRDSNRREQLDFPSGLCRITRLDIQNTINAGNGSVRSKLQIYIQFALPSRGYKMSNWPHPVITRIDCKFAK